MRLSFNRTPLTVGNRVVTTTATVTANTATATATTATTPTTVITSEWSKQSAEEIVNQLFPDAKAATRGRLEATLNRLQGQIAANQADIQSQITAALQAEQELELARQQVFKLAERVQDFKAKLDVVSNVDVPRQLAELDNVKKNLTTAISTLEKLSLLMTTVAELKAKEAKEAKEGRATNSCMTDETLEPLFTSASQLAAVFTDHPAATSNPQVKQLLVDLTRLQQSYRQQLLSQLADITTTATTAGDKSATTPPPFSLASYRLAITLGVQAEYERCYVRKHRYFSMILDCSDVRSAFAWYERTVATNPLPQLFKQIFVIGIKAELTRMCQRHLDLVDKCNATTADKATTADSTAIAAVTDGSALPVTAALAAVTSSLSDLAKVMTLITSCEKKYDMVISPVFKMLLPCFLASEQQTLDTLLAKMEFDSITTGIFMSASDLFQCYKRSIEQFRKIMEVIPVLELMEMFSKTTLLYLVSLEKQAKLSPGIKSLNATSAASATSSASAATANKTVTSYIDDGSQANANLCNFAVVINTLDFINKNTKSMADIYKMEFTEVNDRCQQLLSTVIESNVDLCLKQLRLPLITVIEQAMIVGGGVTEASSSNVTSSSIAAEVVMIELKQWLTTVKQQLNNASTANHFSSKLLLKFNANYVELVESRRNNFNKKWSLQKLTTLNHTKQQQQQATMSAVAATQLLLDLQTIKIAISSLLEVAVKDDKSAELYLKDWLSSLASPTQSPTPQSPPLSPTAVTAGNVASTATSIVTRPLHAIRRSLGSPAAFATEVFGK